jgi:hypothetical protein
MGEENCAVPAVDQFRRSPFRPGSLGAPFSHGWPKHCPLCVLTVAQSSAVAQQCAFNVVRSGVGSGQQ